MWLILIAIFLLFIIWTQHNRKWLCIGVCVLVFLISACKSIESYGDLIYYRNSYLSLQGETFQSLWGDYVNGELKDFGYYATAKIFSLLGFSAEAWVMCIALFFAICVSICFYKNSEDAFISGIILFALYYRFSLSALRQTIALGFILLSYRKILDGKLIHYLLLVGCAFIFHSSALIFLPAYWLARIKIGWKQLAVLLGALVVCAVYPNIVRKILQLVAWNDSIDGYVDREEALSWSGYIIQLAILVFCWVFKKKQNSFDESGVGKVDAWLNLMVIGVCFQGASSIIAEAFRVSYYYSMACMLAIPNVIGAQKKEDGSLLRILVCIVLVAYILYAGMYAELRFFWQG